MAFDRTQYDVFFSYSRKDNLHPVGQDGAGWVTAFHQKLRECHLSVSGKELQIFFDTQEIAEGVDWRRRLGQGLRSSKLFLAFLSPNYVQSANCLWEWQEYVRREHSAARGDDGITPIFFVAPDSIGPFAEAGVARWLEDLHRRNRTIHCEIHPWLEKGPDLLVRMDAAERSAWVKGSPREAPSDAQELARRIEKLDGRILQRLDRIALADLAPGNVVRSHEHFVGRHAELSRLHTLLIADRRGLITAAHSPGGLGKTALARQYAHAYADFYAAGGTWELACEGQTRLSDVLLQLAREPKLEILLTEEQRADASLAARVVLHHLEKFSQAGSNRIREHLRLTTAAAEQSNEIPQLDTPRCLLILNNVDHPELLSADQVALLPAKEWLEILITTRLDPNDFGAGHLWGASLEIAPLPEEDALALLRDFQPGLRFSDASEEAAAREIVRRLGGYTLLVEFAGAFLGAHPEFLPSRYLREVLDAGGTVAVEMAVEDAAVQKDSRYRDLEGRVIPFRKVVGKTLDSLQIHERTVLEFASLLDPDLMPWVWLHGMTTLAYGEIGNFLPGLLDPSSNIWAHLHGLRLLHPAEKHKRDERGLTPLPLSVRIHRSLADFIRTGMNAETLELRENQLVEFLNSFEEQFEQEQIDGSSAALMTTFPAFFKQSQHLVQRHRNPEMLQTLLLAADFEGTHGVLSPALALAERVFALQQELLEANPGSGAARRDVSVSLIKLGGFHLSQGSEIDGLATLRRAYSLLYSFIEENRPMDPQMRAAYAGLKRHFGNS